MLVGLHLETMVNNTLIQNSYANNANFIVKKCLTQVKKSPTKIGLYIITEKEHSLS